jgi:hypothetical protein
VEHHKNWPLGVNTTIELKNITTSDSNGIQQGMCQLIHVPVLSDVVVTLFSSIVFLNPNGNFWALPLLHSVSDMSILVCFVECFALSVVHRSENMQYFHCRIF